MTGTTKPMWVLGQDNPRVVKYKSTDAQRCPICGQYIQTDEPCYLVVCNAIPEARRLKLNNFIPHTTCWDNFCSGAVSDEALAIKFKKHRPPKAKPLSEEQMKNIEAFKYAAYQCGYRIISNTRDNGVRATRNGTTCSVIYNPYADKLIYRDKRKDFLFKTFIDRDIIASFYNKMHEYLEDGKRDDFSATKAVTNVFDEVNKMFGC